MKTNKFRSWISSIQEFVYFENGVYSKFTDDGISVFNWDNAEQYTGLKDSKGKEIYEGGILEYYSKYDEEALKYIVKFGNGSFYLEGENHIESFFMISNDFFKDCKIIGNIHTTPELLK